MSITAPRQARHRAPLSRSTWLRLRRSLTGGLFAVATVAGVAIGLQGASVSPVAPVIAATPVVYDAPVLHHDRGGHR